MDEREKESSNDSSVENEEEGLMEEGNSIFILKSSHSSLKAAETYLKNRNWIIRSALTLKEALTTIIQMQPSYVLIPADHSNKKVKNLPKLLRQAFQVHIIIYAESSAFSVMNDLNEMQGDYKLYPPVSGPSIERMTLKIVKDIQQAEQETIDKERQKSIAENNKDSESINVSSSSEPDKKPKYFRVSTKDDPNSSEKSSEDSEDYTDSFEKAKSALNMLIQSDSDSDSDSDSNFEQGTRSPRLKKKKKSQETSEVESYFEGEGRDSGEMIANEDSEEFSGEDSEEENINPDEASNSQWASSKKKKKSSDLMISKGKKHESGPAYWGGSSDSDSDSDPNSPSQKEGESSGKTPLMVYSDDESFSGASPEERGFSTRKRRKKRGHSSHNSEDNDTDGNSDSDSLSGSELNSLSRSNSSSDTEPSGYSDTEDDSENFYDDDNDDDDNTNDLTNHGDNVDSNNDHDGEKNPDNNSHFFKSGSGRRRKKQTPIMESNHVPRREKQKNKYFSDSHENLENETLIIRGTQQALNESVVVREKHQAKKEGDEIVKATNIACIIINSERFSGYLVAALGKDRHIDKSFMNLIKERLFSFLKTHGELVQDEEESMNIKIEEIEFEDWALEQAQFLRRSIHDGDEIAMAFFPSKETSAKIEESVSEKMLKLTLNDLKDDTPVEFDLYVHLPENNKFLLYTPQGRTFYGDQKNRLKEKGITHMHLRKESVGEVKKYKAQIFLNDKINEYKKIMQTKHMTKTE